jgi:hypothetical protein
MFGENVLGAFHHAAIRPGGRLSLQYRDLAARSGAAFVDNGLRLRFANADPVRTDIGVRIVVRPHVDLDDVNAGLLGALQQARVRLNVGVVNDNDVRLFRDQRGQGLRAGVSAEMRVANLELHPEFISLLFQDRRPSLGEVDAHGDGNEGDRLACEHFEIVGASRIVDALGSGMSRRSRQRQCEREGPKDIPLLISNPPFLVATF